MEERNPIIKLAKKMSQQMYQMAMFARGKGELQVWIIHFNFPHPVSPHSLFHILWVSPHVLFLPQPLPLSILHPLPHLLFPTPSCGPIFLFLHLLTPYSLSCNGPMFSPFHTLCPLLSFSSTPISSSLLLSCAFQPHALFLHAFPLNFFLS